MKVVHVDVRLEVVMQHIQLAVSVVIIVAAAMYIVTTDQTLAHPAQRQHYKKRVHAVVRADHVRPAAELWDVKVVIIVLAETCIVHIVTAALPLRNYKNRVRVDVLVVRATLPAHRDVLEIHIVTLVINIVIIVTDAVMTQNFI